MTTQREKAAALKKAKEDFLENAAKKQGPVTHMIEKRENEAIEIKSETLPELPTLHLRACSGCTVTVPPGTTLVKILIEGCRKCTISLDKITVQTATIEMWRCSDTDMFIDCYVGTFQADLCDDVRITFGQQQHLGSLVQAGMRRLAVNFADAAFPPLLTGVDELRKERPDETINDETDQYITRIVSGALLTERVLRLHNDFPTTLREKSAFDKEAAATSAAMEKLAAQLLNKHLPDNEREEIEKALAAGRASGMGGGSACADADAAPCSLDDTTDAARALFKKNQGNASFKAEDFQQAAVFYTESLLIDDKNHTVLSNRAACFLKLGQAGKALQDADKCIALMPEFVKGYFRRGVALIALERFEEGALSLAKVLEMEPKNAEAKASLQIAQMKAAKARQSR